MERRGRLPGADELFRQTGPRPSEQDEVETGEAFDPRTLAELSELAAAEGSELSAARGRAGQETSVPSPPVGALLAWIASSVAARHVVEVGSAIGVTGLWLLRGMHPKGVLTSIEPDPHAQGLAGQAFDDAGVGDRVRSILGDPLEVLDRLSDHTYDLLVFQRVDQEHHKLLSHAVRLLRPGGVLVARSIAVGSGPEVRARRAFVQALADDDRLTAVVLPLDAGIAVATLRDLEED